LFVPDWWRRLADFGRIDRCDGRKIWPIVARFGLVWRHLAGFGVIWPTFSFFYEIGQMVSSGLAVPTHEERCGTRVEYADERERFIVFHVSCSARCGGFGPQLCCARMEYRGGLTEKLESCGVLATSHDELRHEVPWTRQVEVEKRFDELRRSAASRRGRDSHA
jgi:hypothetical protein